jgi:hypothetical protein
VLVVGKSVCRGTAPAILGDSDERTAGSAENAVYTVPGVAPTKINPKAYLVPACRVYVVGYPPTSESVLVNTVFVVDSKEVSLAVRATKVAVVPSKV